MKANQKNPKVKAAITERSLKIQPRYNITTDRVFPEIKLGGLWLQELGFKTGERVIVKCEENVLVIRRES
jgi:hypothetical protein